MTTTPHNSRPIRLALIGSGIFAQDAHVPSLQNLRDQFEIVAVYSRTRHNAERLAATLPGAVAVYDNVAALLQDAAIEAVDVVLPIDAMAGVVEQALRSGKHLFSEKPIAPDLKTASHLREIYRQTSALFPAQQWMVGENWRYEEAFQLAAEMISNGTIGRPLTCHWALHIPMGPSNKYYQTPWRRSGNIPGGLILDVGVHHIAVLRQLLGEITAVTATVAQYKSDLPPIDSLSATLQFASGAQGVYQCSYAGAAAWPPLLHVVGDGGSLRVQRGLLEIGPGKELRSIPCTGMNGVQLELAGFAAAIRQSSPHRNSAEQAWRDLAVLEAILLSAQSGQVQTVNGKW